MAKRVAFHTLGCKLNFSESAEIGRLLEKEGYERVDYGLPADVTVIHTCSVTGSADKKTRQAIHKAGRISPGGIVVAMGCGAQLKPDEMASWKGVDLILGTHEKFQLPEYLRNLTRGGTTMIRSSALDENLPFHHAHSESERTRAFLKVQDGCDYVCSYCTIPAARGASRNAPVSELVHEAEVLASKGLQEVVLTGVNVGDFGRSTGESFLDLVTALDSVAGIERFRISSIEPNLLSDELIRFVAASGRFAPHFHIPLQSGSDKILKLMRRRYNRSVFASRVEAIRKMIPDAGIGADVITGFPGESDTDFADVLQFIENLPISYLHVFSYSERPGTPAEAYEGQVAPHIRELRSHELHRLSDRMKARFLQEQVHKDEKVIFESADKKGRMTGLSGNYIEAEAPFDENILHRMVGVRFDEVTPELRMKATLLLP